MVHLRKRSEARGPRAVGVLGACSIIVVMALGIVGAAAGAPGDLSLLSVDTGGTPLSTGAFIGAISAGRPFEGRTQRHL